MSGNAATLHVILDKSETEQLEKATAFVNLLLKASRKEDATRLGRFKILDAREPPSVSDLAIHWNVPHGMWLPWTRTSVFWGSYTDEWNYLSSAFDAHVNPEAAFETACAQILEVLRSPKASLPKYMPPLLNAQDCPPISVITLVHNRPLFVQNACLNLMLTDYPKEKIEWVVVDDSDPDQSGSDKIIQFQNTFDGTVTYVPLVKKTVIGKKRNIGVQRAKNNLLLMMDDDDHVPITAFRRRVAWLLKDRVAHECAVCTVLPMYDLRRGLSAVNVPPVTLGLAKRCSEATLTFTRAFWQARPFPETTIAEGEGFLAGREQEVVEMPPQHVIVAFQHGTNSSGRSLPDSAGKGCFWGFDKVYLRFIHGLVGVQIEEA